MTNKVWIDKTGNTLRLRWNYEGKKQSLSIGVQNDAIGRAFASKKMAEISMDMVSGHYDPTLLKYKPRKLGRNPTEISAVKLFQKYTEHRLKERELSHSSKVRLKGIASKLSQFLDGKPAEKVTEAVAKDMIARWSESVSNGTIKERLFDLRACWDWAKGKYHLAEGSNPWSACLERARSRGDNQPKPKEPFSILELEAIVAAFANDRYYNHYTDFVIFLMNTACRPGEAVGLRWESLGADFSIAWIGESISRGHQNTKGTKTGKSRTIWALDPLVQSMLRERFDRVNPQPNDLVFPSPKGLPIDDHRFRARAWKAILEHCHIEYRSPYNLRHSSSSHALANGADPIELAEQMGHSVKTLLSTYAHAVKRKSVFVAIRKG